MARRAAARRRRAPPPAAAGRRPPSGPAPRARARALEERFPSRSRGPFADDPLPLRRADGEYREAVDRRVQAEEVLEDGGEEEDARAGELLLVELELDAAAAREAEAVLGDDARERRRALHREDAGDLLARGRRVREVVESQDLA